MPKVVHVVTTRRFAGVERYVADVGAETAAHGWDVVVVGGNPAAMRRTLDGRRAGCPAAARRGTRSPRASRPRRRVPRPHDEGRGRCPRSEAAPPGPRRRNAPLRGAARQDAARGRRRAVDRGRLARQLAVSGYVAQQIETPADAVLPNAVHARPLLWRQESRVVLVLQRLEPEKDTLTALRAWQESGLAERGWTMRVVGDGSERPASRGVGRGARGGRSRVRRLE